MHVLDIWSSDEQHKGQVDLWENDEANESQQVGEVEEKKKEKETVEGKVEEAKSSGEKAEKEEVVASIWKLLMHSRDHREALVLPLDQKRISMSCTPEQMVGALTETPLKTITGRERPPQGVVYQS